MAASPTRASRKSTGRPVPPAAQPAPADEATADANAAKPAIDATLDAWGAQATRDHLAWEIAACTACLRGARAWREAQMKAADALEAAHLKAADDLLAARSIDDVASIQFELLRADTEQAMQHLTRLSEVSTRAVAEAFQEVTAGLMKSTESLMAGASQWGRWQASLPATPDIVEAEVEHIANPLAASPLLWPAQEATRQAMGAATAAWNDWLQWGSRLQAMQGSTPTH